MPPSTSVSPVRLRLGRVGHARQRWWVSSLHLHCSELTHHSRP